LPDTTEQVFWTHFVEIEQSSIILISGTPSFWGTPCSTTSFLPGQPSGNGLHHLIPVSLHNCWISKSLRYGKDMPVSPWPVSEEKPEWGCSWGRDFFPCRSCVCNCGECRTHRSGCSLHPYPVHCSSARGPDGNIRDYRREWQVFHLPYHGV
jgi:hypothetical protein